MQIVPRSLWLTLLCLVACATTPAGTTDPESVRISNELSATAEVVALDPALRMVTLRGEDGRLVAVLAGEGVRNYDQIAVGDALRVRFRQEITATRQPRDSALGAEAALAGGRAAPGARPAGALGATVSVRVRIESIDVPGNIVVFTLPNGELIVHRMATDQGRQFVKKLDIGDVVQLDYTEALALSIEEVTPAG